MCTIYSLLMLLRVSTKFILDVKRWGGLTLKTTPGASLNYIYTSSVAVKSNSNIPFIFMKFRESSSEGRSTTWL